MLLSACRRLQPKPFEGLSGITCGPAHRMRKASWKSSPNLSLQKPLHIRKKRKTLIRDVISIFAILKLESSTEPLFSTIIPNKTFEVELISVVE